MYGLDLFSGIGGITLALSEWVRPIAYCEIDRYCQGVLLSQMQSGNLPVAPIWDDVQTLRGDMLPVKPDIIYGGFPCQDISVAGRGAGLAGERSGLFFEIARLVGEIRPRFIFLENVPAINLRGQDAVICTLTDLGYDCRWTVVSAAEVGANHRRQRWFLLAYSNSRRLPESTIRPQFSRRTKIISTGKMANTKDTDRRGPDGQNNRWRRNTETGRCRVDGRGTQHWSTEPDVGGTLNGLPAWLDKNMSYLTESHKLLLAYGSTKNESTAEILRQLRNRIGEEDIRGKVGRSGGVSPAQVLFAYLCKLTEASEALGNLSLASQEIQEGGLRILRVDEKSSLSSYRSKSKKQLTGKCPDSLSALSQLLAYHAEAAWSDYRRQNAPLTITRWKPGWEDGFARVAHGVQFRVDRLKCLGNAVVPLQAKEAFERLLTLTSKEL